MARRTVKSLPRYLRLKGQTFWFSRDLPVDCRAAFGKKTWLTNLETADLKQALVQRDELKAHTDEAFAAMQAGTWVRGAGLSPVARGELYRELIQPLSTRVAERKKTLQSHEQEIPPLEAGDILTPEELDSDDEARELELLLHAAEAERDNLRGTQRRVFVEALRGDVEVSQHVDAYALTISSLAKATVSGRCGNIRQFGRWASDRGWRLGSIDRKKAGQYVTEVIDPMDRKTASTHLSSLRLYWSFLHARGHITGGDAKGGPWAGQVIKTKGTRVTRGSKAEEVRAYTEAEVRKLLYSPFPPRMSHAFEPQIRDALLISLLSGMRLEEVVTLWVGEVTGGVFDIQQGKTAAAARRVPIHPALSEVVQRRTRDKKPQDWLFDELASERDPGDIFGKRFRRYRLALGVDDKREGKRPSLVNFHSARKWFAQTASFAGQSDAIIGAVIGHHPDEKNITRAVYIRTTSEEHRRQCVEAVVLPSEVAQEAV